MDQSVLFGVCLPLFANPGVFTFRTPCYETLDPLDSLTVARLAEDLGYDSVWVADHLMLGRDGAILEGWTTLAVVAGPGGCGWGRSTSATVFGVRRWWPRWRPPSTPSLGAG